MAEDPRITQLRGRRAEALAGGGEEKAAQRHADGRLTARERIDLLFDPDSFQEIGTFVTHRCQDFGMQKRRTPGDGVVAGAGRVQGRTTYAFAQDFTVLGGTLSESNARKICLVQEHALKNGCPLVGLNDSGGARIQEGVTSLGGYADIFLRNVLASGVVPQISAVMGPAAGGAVYSPALTDFIVMVHGTSHMFVTGPDVVKAVTQEDVSFEDLGGASVHSTKSGVAHFAAGDDRHAIGIIRRLLGYLPQNNMEDPPRVQSDDDPQREDAELDTLVPPEPDKPYDMHEVIRRIIDQSSFLEVHEQYAQNLIVGFARLDGRSVGIVANQPRFLAGVLDIECSRKGARFIRFCDAFNIPIVTFEDVPGFMPGTAQEWGGIITNGAKLLYAYCEATVPKITVITRKAYGGAYCVMNSKHIRGDVNIAWPTAEIAVMGAEGAAKIIFRKQLAEAKDPQAEQQRIVRELRDTFANPYVAASYGYLDDIIEPRMTRAYLIRALAHLEHKRLQNPPKKHGNMPL
jgi:acetyl-CoA carboxylase carboxyltransferase component